jgi:hypothetical protein
MLIQKTSYYLVDQLGSGITNPSRAADAWFYDLLECGSAGAPFHILLN